MLNSFSVRLIKASKHTVNGMVDLWQREEAFRLEVVLLLILMPIIFCLSVPSSLKLLLVLLLFLTLVVETINSAIETVVDRISLEINTQSRIAKDMGSAAVGMTILMNVIAWIYALFFA